MHDVSTSYELWNVIAPILGIADRPTVVRLVLSLSFDSIPTIELTELVTADCESELKTTLFRIEPIEDRDGSVQPLLPRSDVAVAEAAGVDEDGQ